MASLSRLISAHLPFGYSITKPIYEMRHEFDYPWLAIEKIASLEIAKEKES